jgi:hypothetical protein
MAVAMAKLDSLRRLKMPILIPPMNRFIIRQRTDDAALLIFLEDGIRP